MEIKIQLEKNLISEDIIGSLVSDEDIDKIVGEVVSYDTITGIAICSLYEIKNDD